MAGLTIKNLTKRFGNKKVIDDVSFDVADGEFCILLGPSGCGKSTALRIIAGLEQPNQGEIVLGGRPINGLTPKQRDIAMVFQSYALYPHMNVYQNMAFSLKLRKLNKAEIDKKVKNAAELLSIGELLERKPRELSGGQRQRVAIGRAIVRNPALFLFDEPLSNLDAKLRASMRVEIAALHRKLKNTIIHVTHDQVEAMTLGDRIILLDEGKIQQIGSPPQLYEKPANTFAASFIGTPQMNLFSGAIEAEGERTFFRSKSLKVDITKHPAASGWKGQKVELGVRPEAVIPGKEFSGRIEFIEALGAEKITLVAMKDEEKITARMPPDFSGQIGDPFGFAFKKESLHLFFDGIRG